MIDRSWYGSATLMTTAGRSASSSAAVAALTSSASIAAVRMRLPWSAAISAAILSQRDLVRLASSTSSNTSEACAHLWATTPPTPPAPMMTTFFMGAAT
jgi:hypothetical protein